MTAYAESRRSRNSGHKNRSQELAWTFTGTIESGTWLSGHLKPNLDSDLWRFFHGCGFRRGSKLRSFGTDWDLFSIVWDALSRSKLRSFGTDWDKKRIDDFGLKIEDWRLGVDGFKLKFSRPLETRKDWGLRIDGSKLPVLRCRFGWALNVPNFGSFDTDRIATAFKYSEGPVCVVRGFGVYSRTMILSSCKGSKPLAGKLSATTPPKTDPAQTKRSWKDHSH